MTFVDYLNDEQRRFVAQFTAVEIVALMAIYLVVFVWLQVIFGSLFKWVRKHG